jgi:quercetin dioxygenase-like cupin family protein
MFEMRSRLAIRVVLAIALAGSIAIAFAGCQVGASGAPAASPSPVGGIIRTDLGNTLPGTAPDQRLGLWHYTIPAGSALVPHTHPGWQVARIVAGTLSYTIISGQATVIRSGGGTETHGSGETITLATGDSIVENPDLAHFGTNKGSTPVEIYAASLFKDGSPPAIPLPSGNPGQSGVPAASPAPSS